jgi:hypothetical protein
MSGPREIAYTLDICPGRASGAKIQTPATDPQVQPYIPRIARLMALAIRFEGLLREEAVQDHAELARLGRVTRARISQIMKLLYLAPDIQEQLLFLPPLSGLTERKLRPIASRIDWNEQRRLLQEIGGAGNLQKQARSGSSKQLSGWGQR